MISYDMILSDFAFALSQKDFIYMNSFPALRETFPVEWGNFGPD
jgi:hypothetical protein